METCPVRPSRLDDPRDCRLAFDVILVIRIGDGSDGERADDDAK